jgi:hypothetical protein
MNLPTRAELGNISNTLFNEICIKIGSQKMLYYYKFLNKTFFIFFQSSIAYPVLIKVKDDISKQQKKSMNDCS